MNDGALQLGDIAGKITMLGLACRRCEHHGVDMRLPELRYIIAGDCPRVVADRIYDWCGVYYLQFHPG